MACVGIHTGEEKRSLLLEASLPLPARGSCRPFVKGRSVPRVLLTVVARASRSRGRGHRSAFSNAYGVFYGILTTAMSVVLSFLWASKTMEEVSRFFFLFNLKHTG